MLVREATGGEMLMVPLELYVAVVAQSTAKVPREALRPCGESHLCLHSVFCLCEVPRDYLERSEDLVAMATCAIHHLRRH